jgi:hypothetical protein
MWPGQCDRSCPGQDNQQAPLSGGNNVILTDSIEHKNSWKPRSDRPAGREQRHEKDSISSGFELLAASSNSEYTSATLRRYHFLTLPADGRLQFISGLFEGALPRCISDIAIANGALLQ